MQTLPVAMAIIKTNLNITDQWLQGHQQFQLDNYEILHNPLYAARYGTYKEQWCNCWCNRSFNDIISRCEWTVYAQYPVITY